MSIYSDTKYDPVYHSNIPLNHIQLWNEQKFNQELILTHEEIFNLWREHYVEELMDDTVFPGMSNRDDAKMLLYMVEENQEKIDLRNKQDPTLSFSQKEIEL